MSCGAGGGTSGTVLCQCLSLSGHSAQQSPPIPPLNAGARFTAKSEACVAAWMLPWLLLGGGSRHPPTPSPLGCWLHSHTPAQWFSVLHFLMSALAQISVEQAKPFSHLLMRSFLHLNNPALRKLLWTASLQELCFAPPFLLLHLIRLRNPVGAGDVSRCCSFARLSEAFLAPRARGPANTLPLAWGLSSASIQASTTRAQTPSNLCHCSPCLLLIWLFRLLPPQGFTFGIGFLVLRILWVGCGGFFPQRNEL